MPGKRIVPPLLLCCFIAILLCALQPAYTQCNDRDGDTYYYELGCPPGPDCNDGDPNCNPGAAEICDGFDNDCDGLLDNDVACSGVLDFMASGDEVVVAEPSMGAQYPAVAWNGEGYGVFWEDSRASRGYFVIIDPSGNKLIQEKPLFAGSWAVHDLDIVWTGSEYGLVWQDWRDADGPSKEIYFTILNDRGERVIGDVRLSDQTGTARYPRLVWNGQEYGVFWIDNRVGDLGSRAYFKSVSADGVPGAEIFLDIGNEPPEHKIYTMNIAATWNGEEYGLAVHKRDMVDWIMDLYFVRLQSDGTKEGEPTLIEGDFADSRSYSYLWLTWNGRDSQWGYWWDYQPSYPIPFTHYVHLTRLEADGSFVDPLDKHEKIPHEVNYGSGLNRAAWSGEEYGLLYRPQVSGNYQIHFNRVSEAGQVLDLAIKISSDTLNEQEIVDMAWNGVGFGIVWHDVPGESKYIAFNNVSNDYDGDLHAGRRDCDDDNNQIWAVPWPVRNLRFDADKENIYWDEPNDTGGDSITLEYDVLRSDNPADFSGATCMESDISPFPLSATDTATPPAAVVYNYLVRAQNACGEGSLGSDAGGVPRTGRSCP